MEACTHLRLFFSKAKTGLIKTALLRFFRDWWDAGAHGEWSGAPPLPSADYPELFTAVTRCQHRYNTLTNYLQRHQQYTSAVGILGLTEPAL